MTDACPVVWAVVWAGVWAGCGFDCTNKETTMKSQHSCIGWRNLMGSDHGCAPQFALIRHVERLDLYAV